MPPPLGSPSICQPSGMAPLLDGLPAPGPTRLPPCVSGCPVVWELPEVAPTITHQEGHRKCPVKTLVAPAGNRRGRRMALTPHAPCRRESGRRVPAHPRPLLRPPGPEPDCHVRPQLGAAGGAGERAGAVRAGAPAPSPGPAEGTAPTSDRASGRGAGEGARFGGAAFSTPKAGGSGVGPSWLDDVPHAHLPWGSRELPRFPHAPDGWGCSLK